MHDCLNSDDIFNGSNFIQIFKILVKYLCLISVEMVKNVAIVMALLGNCGYSKIIVALTILRYCITICHNDKKGCEFVE